MKIEFTHEKILRKYRTEFKEGFLLYRNPRVTTSDQLDFDMEYQGNIVTLMPKPTEKRDALGYIKILEEGNKAFENVEYILDKKGVPIDINNYSEIRNKWNQIRKSVKTKDRDEMLTDLIFRLSGIIEHDEALFDLLKRYCIIPYLFTGFHNTEIEAKRENKCYGMIYNLFPLTDIPVLYTLTGEKKDTEESWKEEGDKKILIKGTVDPQYDRFEYIGIIKNRLSSEEQKELIGKIGSFNLEIEGYYLFDAENTLKKMELLIQVGIGNLLNYACQYKISQRLKEEGEIQEKNLEGEEIGEKI